MALPGETQYAHIASNGTTTLNAADGFLIRVALNTAGATGNTLTLLDGSAVISVIDTTTTRESIEIGVSYSTSLVAVLASGTPADLTVVFQ